LSFTEALERRQVIYKNMNLNYLFDLDQNLVIDSFLYGNKLRYANHGKYHLQNSEVKILFVNGNYRIALFANKIIKFGDEICFDYGDSYYCEWIKPFNK